MVKMLVENVGYKKIDLITLPKKSFWKLCIPITIFLLFDTLYGIIDMMWLVNYSNEAAYAVSAAAPLILLITTFGDSIGQGTNSIMSRYIGSNDYEGAYNSLIHGLLVSFIMGLLIVLTIPFLIRFKSSYIYSEV